MGLDPIWWAEDGSGKFKNNTDGDITAGIMREFAQAISEDSPDEWIQLVPGPLLFPASTDWNTPDAQVVVWLNAITSGAGGGGGSSTDGWSYESSPGTLGAINFNAAVMAYISSEDVLATIELSSISFAISGATSGTKVTPVVVTNDISVINAELLSAPVTPELLTIFGPSSIITSATTPLAISARHSLPMSASVVPPAVLIGLLFSPPSGAPISPVEDEVPSISPSSPVPFTVLVSSRPSQPSSSIAVV